MVILLTKEQRKRRLKMTDHKNEKAERNGSCGCTKNARCHCNPCTCKTCNC